MILTNLCTPALIYVIFSVTQIIIDTMRGHFNVAFVKFLISIIFTILLNFLCNKGLGIISWFIVFLPFILMTAIVSILLVMFGLDPLTGKKRITKNIDYLNNDRMFKRYNNDLRFSTYYLNLERKRNKGAIRYSQDMENNFENDFKEYLLYKKLRNERYKKRMQEKRGKITIGKKNSRNDDLITIIDDDENDNEDDYYDIPEPYDPPRNPSLCNKSTNKPLGCPCFFGSSCKSGNCDASYKKCIKRNKNRDTDSYDPEAPNTISQQERQKNEKERKRQECMEDKGIWDGVECKTNNE